MRKLTFWFAFCVLSLVLSCRQQELVTPDDTTLSTTVLPPEIKSGVMSFGNENSFKAYMKDLAENAAKNQSARRKFEGFTSLTDWNISEARKALESRGRSSISTGKTIDDLDGDDEIVFDPNFASVLNQDREVMVAGYVFRITDKGTFYFKPSDKQRALRVIQNYQRSARTNADCPPQTMSVPGTEIADGVYTFNAPCGEVFIPGDPTPVPPHQPQRPRPKNCGLSVLSNRYVTYEGPPITNVFGINTVQYNYFSLDVRVKAKVWDANYGIFSSTGVNTRFQGRNTFQLWSANTADRISVQGSSEVEVKTPPTGVAQFDQVMIERVRSNDNMVNDIFDWTTAEVGFYDKYGKFMPLFKPAKDRIKILSITTCHYVRDGSEDGEVSITLKKN